MGGCCGRNHNYHHEQSPESKREAPRFTFWLALGLVVLALYYLLGGALYVKP